MKAERLKHIKEEVEWQAQMANKILEGDRDNYDGADGARYIRQLCGYAQELLAEITITPD